MKNLDDKQINKSVKTEKKNLASNPIRNRKSPIADAPMISVAKVSQDTTKELTKTKNKLNKLIKPISVSEENSLDSIVETINSFNTTRTKAKSYIDEYAVTTNPIVDNINYFEIMKNIKL